MEPLVPVHEPDPRGGRSQVDDRVCFSAIVFVLFTGIAWQRLPRELGCSPATAHPRLGADVARGPVSWGVGSADPTAERG